MHDRIARLAWFKSIVLPHEAALRKHVRRLITPDLDVDDIVSESLTRAYAADDWPRISNGRSFLFRIARNLLVDAARRRAVVSFEVMADLEALNIADEAPSTEVIVSARDELRRLEKAVDRLPPRCREVFTQTTRPALRARNTHAGASSARGGMPPRSRQHPRISGAVERRWRLSIKYKDGRGTLYRNGLYVSLRDGARHG